MAGNTSQSLLFSLLPSLLLAIARSYGRDGARISQMMFSMASLGLMVASLVSGLVVYRLGIRATLIIAGILYGLAGMLPWATSNIPILLGSRLLVGAACGLLTTTCMMLVAHFYAGPARSRVIGYQTAVGSVAGVAALFAGGATVNRFGWHPAFLLYALFALPLVLMTIAGIEPVPLPPRGVQHGGVQPGVGQIVRVLWPVCIVGCLLMMVALLTASEVPFVLKAIGVIKPMLQSTILSMSTVFVVLGSALFGRIQILLGSQRTFAMALCCAAVGMAIVALGVNGPVVGLGCALLGMGIGLYIPHLWVVATSLVSEAVRGHAIGILTTSMFLGGFLYPFPFGVLQHAIGLSGALLVLALALAAGSAAILVGGRTRLAGAAA